MVDVVEPVECLVDPPPKHRVRSLDDNHVNLLTEELGEGDLLQYGTVM